MIVVVPEAGLEPARPYGHWILSPVRLPIPPPGQGLSACRKLPSSGKWINHCLFLCIS